MPSPKPLTPAVPAENRAGALPVLRDCAHDTASASALAQREMLAARLGGTWSLICQGDAVGAFGAASSLPPSVLHAVAQGEGLSRAEPQIVVADGATWVLVPVEPESARSTLVGRLEGSQEQVASRLIAALLATHADQLDHAARHQQQIDDFSRQVTVDFEELSWLRNLTESIELCNLQHSINDVAASVLPTLRELTGAEAIAILPLPDPADSHHGLAPSFVCGQWNLGDDDCRQIIAVHGAAALVGPVVRNETFHGCGQPERFCAAHGFVLVHIGQGREQVGWLLAVNKLPADPMFAVDARACSADEFGTNEAGMVLAAAVLLGNHAHNLVMFREQEDLFRGVVKALVDTIEAKDSYTRGHSDRVARMARRLAEEVGFGRTESEQVYMAGLLHDIGKIGVPDEILLKPGKLTDEEFALVKKHPEIGYSILKHLDRLSYAFPGVLHHHESVDGSGYPHGLKGHDIPRCARVLAVVDAYDAMTSNRPYRSGMSTEQAEEILHKGAHRQWDAEFVEAFLAVRSDMHAICGLSGGASAAAPGIAAATAPGNAAAASGPAPGMLIAAPPGTPNLPPATLPLA